MTSSAPWTDLALQALREAGRGDYSRLDAASRHDLDAARGMSPGERFALLEALLQRAQALGGNAPNLEPIHHTEMRL